MPKRENTIEKDWTTVKKNWSILDLVFTVKKMRIIEVCWLAQYHRNYNFRAGVGNSLPILCSHLTPWRVFFCFGGFVWGSLLMVSFLSLTEPSRRREEQAGASACLPACCYDRQICPVWWVPAGQVQLPEASGQETSPQTSTPSSQSLPQPWSFIAQVPFLSKGRDEGTCWPWGIPH